jgi:coatomer subunit beta'
MNHTASAHSIRESFSSRQFSGLNNFARPLFLLGYIPAHNRVYLVDKDMNVHSYSLSLGVVEYQTAVLRGDTDAAAEILPTLPKDQLNKVARFLEGKGPYSFFFLSRVVCNLF